MLRQPTRSTPFPSRRSSDLRNRVWRGARVDLHSRDMRLRSESVVNGFTLIELLVVIAIRSEEHTSELQSRFELVCRLLLEKQKLERKNTLEESPAVEKTEPR